MLAVGYALLAALLASPAVALVLGSCHPLGKTTWSGQGCVTWARSVGSENPRGHRVPARGWPTCADAMVVRAPPAASSTFGYPLLSGQLPKVCVQNCVFPKPDSGVWFPVSPCVLLSCIPGHSEGRCPKGAP